MGMFDWYEPNPPLKCPICGSLLDQWQGKAGPNALLLWKQGEAAPAVMRAFDVDLPYTPDAEDRLPDTFEIHDLCGTCDHFIQAQCTAQDGVWREVVVDSAETVKEKNRSRQG